MKKILILLSTFMFSSSSSAGIVLNYKSFSLSENPDASYIDDSKYVAINNIIGKNNNLTVNDLLAFEENEIPSNTIAKSTKHLFNDFQDENMMISSNSTIGYYESNSSDSFYNDNKLYISIQNILSSVNGSSETSIMQISQFVNFTQILSSVVGNLININFSSFIGNSINKILGNDNFITSILDNISITQLAYEMNKFETYNINGDADINNSPFNNKLYSDVVKSTESNFENAIIDDSENNGDISKNMPIIIDGILMLMNFISQFPFNTSNVKEKNIFNSANDDSVVKMDVYNLKYRAINYKNLSDLFGNLADADSNNGLGIEQLMFVLFGFSKNELDEESENIATTRTNPGPEHIQDDLRLKINKKIGPSSYQPMPGVNFSWNDPLISFANGVLEATINSLYKAKKFSFNYIIPIKFNKSEPFYNISANANMDIVKDILGPIVYQIFNDVIENNYLNATYDTLLTFIRAASLEKGSIKPNSPWEKETDGNLKNIMNNLIDKNYLNYSLPTLTAYPLAVPYKKIITIGYFDNPKWIYDNYSSLTDTTTNMWNEVWSGTGSSSILKSFSDLLNLLEGLIPTGSTSSYTTSSSQSNITLPENLKSSFDTFLSTKVFQDYTGEDVLNIAKTAILNFDSVLSSISELFNSLTNLNLKLSSLYQTYIDSSKDPKTFATIINRNSTYYNGSFAYLEAILYGVSKNYLISSKNINELNNALLSLLGYNSANNTVADNSFIDNLFKSQLFKSGLNIISKVVSVSKANFMNKLNLSNWSISKPTITNNNWSYSLTAPDKTNYLVTLLKNNNDEFYTMTIEEK